jgi:hypothetical protein
MGLSNRIPLERIFLERLRLIVPGKVVERHVDLCSIAVDPNLRRHVVRRDLLPPR